MKRTHIQGATNERGIAMITTLLVLMLMSALLIGFTTVVMTDQRYRFIDRDRGQAFYAASAGIEKLTADLGNLFLTNVAPTAAQVQALTVAGKMPVISGITFTQSQAPAALPASQVTDYHCIGRDPLTNLVTNTKTPTLVGTNGYMITFCKLNASGNPTVSDDNLIVSNGAFAQMTALQTPYQIDVTAKTSTGGEVHLSRTIQAVAIPVFQFAMFSESDLSFFAGPNFGMNGRVHTNGNMWLAQGPGATLTINGRVTAFKDYMRQTLANGNSIDNGPTWTGNVSLATNANAPVGNRLLLRTEGSVGNAAWQTISTGASPANYNSFVRNGLGAANPLTSTGAKKLSLPLISPGVGGTNVDIVRRPPNGEDTTGILYNERLFTKASIRILLSDLPADITNTPGVTAGAPVNLETNWAIPANVPAGPPAYGPVTVARPPAAMSTGARRGVVNGTGGGPLPGTPTTITLTSNADALRFKPRFALCNGACGAVPANPITCEVKTNATQLTTCANVPAGNNGYRLYMVSASNSLTGVFTTITANVAAGAATLPVASTANFNPLPFWNTATNPPTYIGCTGYDTTTRFTGCSSAPAVNSILVSGAMSDPTVGLLGGYLKIERNNADGTGWTDITTEMLNYGIGDANDSGTGCGDPTPNAIIRLQRLRDNAGVPLNVNLGGGCNYNTDLTGATDPTNWWPYVLFDAREGLLRDWDYPNPAAATPATAASDASDPRYLTFGGAMYYVNIDVLNLQRWFKHNTAPYNVAASTGNLSKIDGTGFSVYFSDRRGNRNALNQETGEFGWEDNVNPTVANGVPNTNLDAGEDVNEDGVQQLYGGFPSYNGVYNTIPPCLSIANTPTQTCAATYAGVPGITVLTPANTKPQTPTISPMIAQMNRPFLFRRALMLSNGANIGANPVVADRLTGLTIVSENPVYVRGNWNADIPAGTGFGGVNAATSIIADAVTLLSGAWTDSNSFNSPYNANLRPVAGPGWYRVAIIGGKGRSFNLPNVGNGLAPDFGTDGGAHNFLRFLEDWNPAIGQQTVNYLGSLASLYYNRQATGTYKCCNTVYGAPLRNYAFDTNFVNPALLPPLTPMFRDINVIGFSQELRPGK